MKTSKTICLFSMPRCGSNHFCDLMWNLENIVVNAEIFHPKAFYGNINTVNKLSSIYKIDNLDFEEKRIKLAQIRFNDPVGFYKNFKKTINEDYVFFKVFDHLVNKKTNNLKLFPFLIEDVDYCIFLKRNYIDSYISKLKADTANTFTNINTTNIKVKFDIEGYSIYKDNSLSFFSKIKKHMKKLQKPIITFNYEKMILLTDEEQIKYISKKLNKLDCNVVLKKELCLAKHKIQDHSESYEEKLENYKEVKKFIEKQNEKYRK